MGANLCKGCLKTEKKRKQLHPQEKKITLEQQLLASPGVKMDCISNRVYPSLTRVHAHVSSKPRESSSMVRMVKVDKGKTKRDLEVSSLSRSQNGKSKKKVSFRLPEEADIIIFYSPAEQEFGEWSDEGW